MSCTLALRESRQRPSKIDKKVLVPLSVEEEEEKGGRLGDVRRWRHNTQDTDELEIKIISITSTYAQFLTTLIEARLSVSKEIMNLDPLDYHTLTHDDT